MSAVAAVVALIATSIIPRPRRRADAPASEQRARAATVRAAPSPLGAEA